MTNIRVIPRNCFVKSPSSDSSAQQTPDCSVTVSVTVMTYAEQSHKFGQWQKPVREHCYWRIILFKHCLLTCLQSVVKPFYSAMISSGILFILKLPFFILYSSIHWWHFTCFYFFLHLAFTCHPGIAFCFCGKLFGCYPLMWW